MDNILFKKVMTYKSGKFVFSRNYSVRKINPLLIESRILYETVKDLPILPNLASNLRKDLIRRSIFGTAAIEGNPLPEERVGELVSSTGQKESTERAEQEILNLKQAYELVELVGETGKPPLLTEKIIGELHQAITYNVNHEYKNPGKYRNHKVQVGDQHHGGKYTPPKCLADIKTVMREFISWINSDEVIKLDNTVRAALAHYNLAMIHPFGDGNGRTARLIEAAMLQFSGIKYVPVMMSNFYYRNMDDYFWTFSNTRKAKQFDVTPFLSFVLKGFIESLREIKTLITYYIRKFTLRDYYEYLRKTKRISQRQFDLMITLLDHDKPFILKNLFDAMPFRVLYQKVSEKTARRDLKKLSHWLLIKKEDNTYKLDWKVLE